MCQNKTKHLFDFFSFFLHFFLLTTGRCCCYNYGWLSLCTPHTEQSTYTSRRNFLLKRFSTTLRFPFTDHENWYPKKRNYLLLRFKHPGKAKLPSKARSAFVHRLFCASFFRHLNSPRLIGSRTERKNGSKKALRQNASPLQSNNNNNNMLRNAEKFPELAKSTINKKAFPHNTFSFKFRFFNFLENRERSLGLNHTACTVTKCCNIKNSAIVINSTSTSSLQKSIFFRFLHSSILGYVLTEREREREREIGRDVLYVRFSSNSWQKLYVY